GWLLPWRLRTRQAGRNQRPKAFAEGLTPWRVRRPPHLGGRMRRIILFLLACVVALALNAASALAQASRADQQRVLRKIAYYRTAAWRLQTLTMHRRTTSTGAAWRRHDYGFRLHVLHGWRHRAAAVWRIALHPPNLRSWECIHRGEGAWRSNTGNGYYGGLQMDLEFQQ